MRITKTFLKNGSDERKLALQVLRFQCFIKIGQEDNIGQCLSDTRKTKHRIWKKLQKENTSRLFTSVNKKALWAKI